MRRPLAATLALLCLTVAPVLVPDGPAAADAVRLAADPWPPYVDRALPHRGLAVGIVTEALSRAGHDASLSIAEWEHVMEGTREGSFDAIVATWHSEERAAYLAYSEPYLFNELKLVKLRASTFTFGDILARKRPELTMGLVRDYAYGEALAPLKSYANSTQTYLTQTLLRLVKQEVDFVVGDDLAVRYHMRELLPAHADRVEIAEEPLARIGLRFAVAQAYPEKQALLADFARGLAEIKGDGTLAKMLSAFDFSGDGPGGSSAPGSGAPASPAAR